MYILLQKRFQNKHIEQTYFDIYVCHYSISLSGNCVEDNHNLDNATNSNQ